MCLRMYAHAVTGNPSTNWHQTIRSRVRSSTNQPATQLPMLSTVPPQAIYTQHHYHHYFLHRTNSLHTDDTVIDQGKYAKGIREVWTLTPLRNI